MIGKKAPNRHLDPKLCFELWNQAGSVYKVPHILREKYGIFNPKTGKNYSQQGVFLAAGTYVTEHLVEAKEVVAQVWKANGQLLSDPEWYKMVLDKAKYLSKKQYKIFIESHPYLTPYLNQ